MRIKSFDGTRIFYEYKKSKKKLPCLVFVHGVGSDNTCWKKEIQFFRKFDYPILMFDLRGHGKSDIPQKSSAYNLKNVAKDLNFILKREKINEIVLIGHSMGGMVTLVFCDLFPKRVKALILCDTTYMSPYKDLLLLEIQKGVILAKEILMFLSKNKKFEKKYLSKDLKVGSGPIDKYWQAAVTFPFSSLMGCYKAMYRYDETKVLPRIKVPTLIIASNKDEFFTTELEQDMCTHIKNARIIVIDGTHRIIDDKPFEVSNIILSFLENNKLR